MRESDVRVFCFSFMKKDRILNDEEGYMQIMDGHGKALGGRSGILASKFERKRCYSILNFLVGRRTPHGILNDERRIACI